MNKGPTKPGVVYVAGCGHSGGTVLGLLLTLAPGVIALDPVAATIDAVRRPGQRDVIGGDHCSCGVPADECEFWGPTLAELDTLREASLGERYACVRRRAREVFGEDVCIVDTSRNAQELAALATALPDDPTVVKLIRDVRSWTVSSQDRAARRGHLPGRTRRHGRSPAGSSGRPGTGSAGGTS